MKKIYLQPELEIIKVQTTQMMAASLPIINETVTDEDVLAPEMNLDVLTSEMDLDSFFE